MDFQKGIRYTVKSGDTLSAISLRFTGSTLHAENLYSINASTLRGLSSSEIFPGELIFIPEDLLAGNYWEEKVIKVVRLENDKYEFGYDERNGTFWCQRYGDPWRNLNGDKAVLALFNAYWELKNENHCPDCRQKLLTRGGCNYCTNCGYVGVVKS